eukprot:1794467-Rhodomonas_salina.4
MDRCIDRSKDKQPERPTERQSESETDAGTPVVLRYLVPRVLVAPKCFVSTSLPAARKLVLRMSLMRASSGTHRHKAHDTRHKTHAHVCVCARAFSVARASSTGSDAKPEKQRNTHRPG